MVKVKINGVADIIITLSFHDAPQSLHETNGATPLTRRVVRSTLNVTYTHAGPTALCNCNRNAAGELLSAVWIVAIL